MSITVITPSLPERAELLGEAIASVQAQTLQADAHMIWLDADREGPAVCRNRMLERVTTEHVAFLDDDDELYPFHLEVLASAIEDADLAFSWHDGGPGVPRFDEWNAAAEAMTIGGRSVIPVTVLARTEAIRAAGCFRSEDRYEDWSLFCRMLENGCSFVCVPWVTWHYRISEDGRTWNP